jgi:CHAT domain-containing protein
LDLALVADTLVAWVVRDGRIEQVHRGVTAAQVAQAIARARAAMEVQSEPNVVRPELARLYDWLIRPVLGRLGRDSVLTIIADPEIAAAPFPALLDRETGRYLIETHSLLVALSLLDATRRVRSAPALATPAAVLITAQPAESTDSVALAPLPGAASEVADIARLYERPAVIVGARVSPDSLRSAFEAASVVHFAGHAVVDDARPEQSFLALDNAARRRLTARDVATLHLHRVGLVVLSACETATPGNTTAAGVSGLSASFLRAGAKGVVGTLWPVDDMLMRPLMVEFHRAYRATGDAVSALRAAQLTFLRSPTKRWRSPATWAAVRYVGN